MDPATLNLFRLLLKLGPRGLLALTVSVLLALFLSTNFVWFDARSAIGAAILITCVGIVWEARARVGVGMFDKVDDPPISKPVTFLGLAFIGFFWGGLFILFFHSTIVSAAMLALSALGVGILFKKTIQHQFASTLYFSIFSLMAGYMLLIALRFIVE